MYNPVQLGAVERAHASRILRYLPVDAPQNYAAVDAGHSLSLDDRLGAYRAEYNQVPPPPKGTLTVAALVRVDRLRWAVQWTLASLEIVSSAIERALLASRSETRSPRLHPAVHGRWRSLSKLQPALLKAGVDPTIVAALCEPLSSSTIKILETIDAANRSLSVALATITIRLHQGLLNHATMWGYHYHAAVVRPRPRSRPAPASRKRLSDQEHEQVVVAYLGRCIDRGLDATIAGYAAFAGVHVSTAHRALDPRKGAGKLWLISQQQDARRKVAAAPCRRSGRIARDRSSNTD